MVMFTNLVGIALAFTCPVLMLTPAGAAQARMPVCDLVSGADATAVLGTAAEKKAPLGPDQCVFTTKGVSLMVGRLLDQEPEAVRGIIQLPKQRARQGDVVKDEAGIGDAATSELTKGSAALFVAEGDTVWTFRVDHVYSKDLSDMLPRLRELAKKVIAGR